MMMVTIFRGPCGWFRVRELAADTTEASTVQWTSFYYDAVEFVRSNYRTEQVRSPEEFKQEVLKRKETTHGK